MSFTNPVHFARLNTCCAIFAAFGLLGCARSTVRIPARDTTAPMAILDVVGADRTLVLAVGDDPQAVPLPRRDSLILIAVGEDADGGVKDLSLIGNAVVTCKDAATGRLKSRSTGFARLSLGSAAANPRAPMRKSNRFVLRADDFRELCHGRILATVVGQATARAVNFHGGSSDSPRLEFRIEAAADTSVAEAPPLRPAPGAAPVPVLGPLLPGETSPTPLRRSTKVSPSTSLKVPKYPGKARAAHLT